DSAWARPVARELHLGEFRPLKIGSIQHEALQPHLIAQGTLVGPFESVEKPNWPEEGDISWYKRNLHPPANPTGVWRRYDLGRVRLGRPRFELDLPSGAVVEFAYSECLYDRPIVDGYLQREVVTFSEPPEMRDPRVVPYIPLSHPTSRNLDHFIA